MIAIKSRVMNGWVASTSTGSPPDVDTDGPTALNQFQITIPSFHV